MYMHALARSNLNLSCEESMASFKSRGAAPPDRSQLCYGSE
eukprot:SAG31_NODE_42950_length_269_cov_0.811765_1_plen_40_part_01